MRFGKVRQPEPAPSERSSASSAKFGSTHQGKPFKFGSSVTPIGVPNRRTSPEVQEKRDRNRHPVRPSTTREVPNRLHSLYTPCALR
jgi:hypothetical protein